MKKLTVGLFAGLLLPLCASADFIGFHMGGGIWQKSYGGQVQTGLINIDLEDDFGIQDGKDLVLHAAFEHPLPGIPNIRVQYVPIEAKTLGESPPTILASSCPWFALTATSEKV